VIIAAFFFFCFSAGFALAFTGDTEWAAFAFFLSCTIALIGLSDKDL
jgi:hypothetical protein